MFIRKQIIKSFFPNKMTILTSFTLGLISGQSNGMHRLARHLQSPVKKNVTTKSHSHYKNYLTSSKSNNNKELLHALQNGDINTVKSFVASQRYCELAYATQTKAAKSKLTLLELMVYRGDTKTLNKLLTVPEIDFNTSQTFGSMLKLAAFKNQTEATKTLLEYQKIEVDKSDIHGDTALTCAAFHGHTEILKILINARANINHADDCGWTALHNAAKNNDVEATQILIEAGANQLLKNNASKTARDLGNAEIKKLLSLTKKQT